MHDDNKIIDGLGGTTRTAEMCEISPAAVSQWRLNGIPKAQRKYLRAIRPDVFVESQHPPAPAPHAEPQ